MENKRYSTNNNCGRMTRNKNIQEAEGEGERKGRIVLVILIPTRFMMDEEMNTWYGSFSGCWVFGKEGAHLN